MISKDDEGILIRFSVGIGYTISDAEKAVLLAKNSKNKNHLYNIRTLEENKIRTKLDTKLPIVKSYYKLQSYLEKNNPNLLSDLDNFKYDKKTGLLNRVGYIIELNKSYISKKRCVIFLDADYMHEINEKHGYKFVDKYLNESAKELQKNIRQKHIKKRVDILFYINDVFFHRKNDSAEDEFVIDLDYNQENLDFAKKIAKRYLENIYSAQKRLSKKLKLF